MGARRLVAVVLMLVMLGPSFALRARAEPAPTFDRIDLATGDLEFSAVTGLIYASVPSGSGVLSDSIVTIDPSSGAIGAPIPIGSDPGVMDISPSGETIFVALNGSSTVRSFDVVTATPGGEFSVGFEPKANPGDPDVPLVPVELAAIPGDPDSVVVLSKPSSSTGGEVLAVYTNGVSRPNTVEMAGSLKLEFGSEPGRLYGFAGSTNNPTFERFDVDANGVTLIDRTTDLIPGGRSPGDIEFHEGRIYATAGVVLDPKSLSVTGSFFEIDFALFRGYLLVEPGHPSNTTYYLRDDATPGIAMSLEKYDSTTFSLKERTQIQGPTGIPTSLISTGEHRLAFRTSDDEVWLLANLGSLTPQGSFGLVDTTTGVWYLRHPIRIETTTFYYGNPGDYPMIGDWDCDGDETPGLYRQSDGFVYLRNSNTQGVGDIRFFFGNPGDIPLAGDFNNDGCDTVSIYRPSEGRAYIINELGQDEGGLGAADFAYYFGNPGDKPFIGDFDNDGIDELGLHRESTGLVYFRLTHTQGIADSEFIYGNPGDKIIAANWAHGRKVGPETVGLFRPSEGRVYLRYSNSQGIADVEFIYGNQNMLPVAGNFGELPGGGTHPR